MPSDEDAGVLEWEAIPDDVLVPRRTKRRRHRFREAFAPDVLLVGQTRRVRARVDDAFAALFTASDSRARGDGAARSSRARSRPPRSRPAQSSWDGEWTADHASAAVAEAADRDPPDPIDVLAAHLSAGWTLRPPSKSPRDPTPLPEVDEVDARTLELRPPRPDDRRDGRRDIGAIGAVDDAGDKSVLDGLAHLRLAHGLVPPPAIVPDAHAHTRALSRLAGAVSAARLSGVVLRHRRWCEVAVDEALAAAEAVDSLAAKRSGPLRDGRAARAAAALAHTARAALQEATRALRRDDRDEGGRDVDGAGGVDDDSETESASDRDDPFARAMAAMGGGGGRVGGGGTRKKNKQPGVGSRPGAESASKTPSTPKSPSKTPSSPKSASAFSAVFLASALDDAAHAVAYHARSCGWLDARVGVGFELASYSSAVDAHGAGLDAASAAVAAKAARARPNPLLATLRSRLREGARLFASADVRARLPHATLAAANDTATRANDARAAAPLPPPPPCAPAARRWRDACRVWPCHVYAFAAPTDAAIATLAEASDRWVEVGAGTGYWASLMRAAGMDVVAVDADPPGTARGNEYHGDAAGWTEVTEGGAETPRRLRDEEGVPRALFLCYPPPGESMASEALHSLLDAGGRTVAVVGEWDGNTADETFARTLARSFRLRRRRRLPQWGDTAHELTVWTRRDDEEGNEEGNEEDVKDGETREEWPFGACSACGGGDASSLRRCAYCRAATYCSAKCAERHAGKHAAAHEAAHVPFPDASGRPAFDDDRDYAPYRPTGLCVE